MGKIIPNDMLVNNKPNVFRDSGFPRAFSTNILIVLPFPHPIAFQARLGVA